MSWPSNDFEVEIENELQALRRVAEEAVALKEYLVNLATNAPDGTVFPTELAFRLFGLNAALGKWKDVTSPSESEGSDG